MLIKNLEKEGLVLYEINAIELPYGNHIYSITAKCDGTDKLVHEGLVKGKYKGVRVTYTKFQNDYK